jgi:hypothetical protein
LPSVNSLGLEMFRARVTIGWSDAGGTEGGERAAEFLGEDDEVAELEAAGEGGLK